MSPVTSSCVDLLTPEYRRAHLSAQEHTAQAAMADCVGFQAQIASIIEILANSAVVEICKLVDDGYAALRSQMEQERQKSEKENDVLRQKLRDMDVKMRSYERKMRRRSQREEITAAHFRPPEGPDDHRPLVPLPARSEDKSLHQISKQGETKVLPLVKQEKVERDDCNLDLKVEVNIMAECGLSTAAEQWVRLFSAPVQLVKVDRVCHLLVQDRTLEQTDKVEPKPPQLFVRNMSLPW